MTLEYSPSRIYANTESVRAATLHLPSGHTHGRLAVFEAYAYHGAKRRKKLSAFHFGLAGLFATASTSVIIRRLYWPAAFRSTGWSSEGAWAPMKLYWSLRMKTLRWGRGSSCTSTSSDFETRRAKSPRSMVRFATSELTAT